jgi:heterodisulfide reductase subunit A-like polyferredoxin/coenzyme F420-reducing hydrogenase delta subunit
LTVKIAPKIGVFISDEGGGLGKAIDLPAVVTRLGKIKNIGVCELLAGEELSLRLGRIRNLLQEGTINRIVWVGRFSENQRKKIEKELAAAGLNRFLHEWCNPEEQGIGDGAGDREIQNQKGMILMQMAIARARLLESLEPVTIPGTNTVLIVGAGAAGLHTAVSFIEQGKRVLLAEKESGVGGKVAALRRLYPRICDPLCGLEYALQKLRASDLCEIHTLSKVKKVNGAPGNFEAVIERLPRYVLEDRCNGCGECIKVCPASSAPTGNLREGMASPRKAIHPAEPMAFPSAFVVDRPQCPPDCRRCAEACPALAVNLEEQPRETTVKAGAVLVTTGWDGYPLSKVEEYGYGVYPQVVSNLEMEALAEDPPDLKEVGFIQCAGSRDERHLSYCSSVCCSATLKQVLHLKEIRPEARCYIFYQDIRTPGFDEELYQKVKSLDQVLFIRGNPSTVKPGEKGKIRVRAEDTFSAAEIKLDLDLLVLAGGMVPSEGTREMAGILKLPQNAYGFFEAHLPCHPEESQKTGIRVGGACRGPMGIAHSLESSHRAAMDLLPFVNETIQIEPGYPELNLTKCDKCKRCIEECPYGSYSFDPNGFPALDLTKCRQCGNCMGICPLSAISMRNLTIAQLAAQIRAIKPSFMAKEEPVILSFLCQNDAYFAARTAAEMKLGVPLNVFFIKLPCAGSVNNALIADALAFGIDGILIGGCKDSQCHFIKGNQLVKTRSEDLADKLRKMVIEPGRVRLEAIEIRDSRRYAALLREYAEELKKMGPNPFRS